MKLENAAREIKQDYGIENILINSVHEYFDLKKLPWIKEHLNKNNVGVSEAIDILMRNFSKV